MKKFTKIVLLALTLALLLAVPFAVSASENEPVLKIEAANLSFEDSVYPVFAVSGDNVDMQSVKLLVWTSPKTSVDEYIKGTENAELSSYGDETIDGVACKKFKYTKIYAKNMTDDIYVRAYAELDGEPVYSGITKYSVLRYAYNKLGYTGTATTDANLKEMLEGMLLYGAGAQKYFDYKTDRLATSKFYKITVEGGYLPDGTSSGLFLEGEKVALCAPGIDKDGKIFVAWSDDGDNYVSRESSYEVLLKNENMVLKSTYSSASNGLEFISYGDGTCRVAGIGSCSDVDIVIPAVSPDGDRVKGISYEAFKGCSSLTSITIPDSVTFIGSSAFEGCSSLTSIAIPDSVTIIKSRAFLGCSSLTSITIPDSVTFIGSSAFEGCSSLTSIAIPDSVTSIESRAFLGCSNLTSIAIPAGVTSIGNSTFNGCSNLTSITIPDGVTNIGNFTFYGCSSLTSITIPDSVTSFGDLAFGRCSSLKDVHYTGTIENWCNISFGGSDSNPMSNGASFDINGVIVTNVRIPNTVTEISNYVFDGCLSLTSITIHDGVTSIGEQAFYGCSSLTSITIPDSVTSIQGQAFYGCSSLTSITIPAGVTSIGNSTFYGCSSLKDVHYTGTIENWCNISFDGSDSNPLCNSANLYINEELVTELTIPDSITEINDRVFYGCRSLITVTIGNNIKSIGGGAFCDCDNLTSVTIDNGVTTIGGSAFRNCRNLTNITIPDSVTSIGPDAFWLCSSLAYNDYDNAYYLGNDDNPYVVLVDAKHYYISSVEINVNTKVIYDQAFIYCSSLTSITIPDGVTCIGGYVFMDCSSLTSVTIPDGVTNIGNFTFYGCSSLTSITIPDDVTSIGWRAFEDCSSLTDIYYTGSEEQWTEINIGSDNSPLTNATIHYNYVPEN